MRRSPLSLLLAPLLLLACNRAPSTPPAPRDTGATIAPPVTAAPVAGAVAAVETGRRYLVVSQQVLASEAGRGILAAGGNAVDAAVATSLALAVVYPAAGNLGGGGFAVVRLGPGRAEALDFREVAPAAATETMFLDAQGEPTDASLVGHRAAGVPGSVAGLWELHRRHGKTPWAALVAPAIALARDGFVVDERLAASLAVPHTAARLRRFAASRARWYQPGATAEAGAPIAAGTRVTQPELAATLERIAAQGPDGFYGGQTAALLVAEMERGGGLITAADLAAYRPAWREPLRFGYRGRSLVSMPPQSSGGVALAMTAGMLAETPVGTLPYHGVAHVHRLAEVWRRAFAARNELLGDPAFVPDLPVARLLDPAEHARLAAGIGDRATPSSAVAPLAEGSHTTNLCVVGPDDTAVVITTTLNTSFGSGVTVEGAGFLLNNEMDDFTARPGKPNVFGLVQGAANKIEPGKRMLSSMSPTIVEGEGGRLELLVGAAGGPRIITAVWQALSNVLDFGQPVAAAVAAPRVHHQHLPDVLRAEAGALDAATTAALQAAGHTVDESWQPREFGTVTAIARTPEGWAGAADPRGGGGARGD